MTKPLRVKFTVSAAALCAALALALPVGGAPALIQTTSARTDALSIARQIHCFRRGFVRGTCLGGTRHGERRTGADPDRARHAAGGESAKSVQ